MELSQAQKMMRQIGGLLGKFRGGFIHDGEPEERLHGGRYVLRVLSEYDGRTVPELCPLTGIPALPLRTLLDQLVRENLVEDRDGAYYVTQAGKTRAGGAKGTRQEQLDQLISGLSAEEQEELAALIGKLAAANGVTGEECEGWSGHGFFGPGHDGRRGFGFGWRF